MFLLALCAVASHLVLTQSLIYSEHPIVDVADKLHVPIDLLETRHDIAKVGLVIHKNSVKQITSGAQTLGSNFKAGDYYPNPQKLSLCPSLENEKAVFPSGTGFVIANNRLATSYHVVEALLDPSFNVKPNNKNVKDLRIVFNFVTSGSSSTGTRKTAIYNVDKILDESSNCDLITLSLPEKETFNHDPKSSPFILADHKALPVKGQKVYMLGHPLGMTMRYTTGQVIQADPKGDFTSFVISGFSGNSGSPIIDYGSGKVLGVFAFYNANDGKQDFELEVSKKCYLFHTQPTGVDNPAHASVPVTGPPAWLMRSNAPLSCPRLRKSSLASIPFF